MTTSNGKSNYWVIILIAVVLIGGLVMLGQTRKEPSDRLENAAEEIGEGLEDAGRELDPHRSAGEKIGDAIEDAGESIEDATDR